MTLATPDEHIPLMRAHPLLALFEDGVVYLRVVHAYRHLGVRVSADSGNNAEVTHRAASMAGAYGVMFPGALSRAQRMLTASLVW